VILDEVKKYPELSEILIDRDKLLRSLGIDMVTREYIVLAELTIPELQDLQIKSLMWSETVNEALSTAELLRDKQAGETERIASEVIKNMMSMETEYKVTEAKAHAKASPKVIEASNKLSTLVAYCKFLDRLRETIDKYHYTVKGRTRKMDEIERKY